jgi:adenylyltransferase/sulfurtransferase
MLADEQIDRYSRQIILPQVGGKGQERLLQAKVLVVGAGETQISALLYLAAAGVGTVGVIIDQGSSLLRAFPTDGSEAERIGKTLTALNPDCAVKTYSAQGKEQVAELVEGYDLVLSPPHPIHDLCYVLDRPFICGASLASCAWLLTCQGYQSGLPCLRCLRSHSPFNSSEEPLTGVLNQMAAGFLGTLQATEAIKLILRVGQPASDRALVWDFLSLHFSQTPVAKDPACSLCAAPR